MTVKIDDELLQGVLDEVRAQIFGLAKAEVSPPPEEESAEASAPAAPAAAEANPAPAPEASPEAAEAAPEAPAPVDPAAPAPDAPMDLEGLKAEYAQLPPEELKMHFLACKAAMMALAGGMEASAPAPEASPAAPAPAAPAMGAAMKSEVATVAAALKKSQADYELVSSDLASTKENMQILAEALEALVSSPVRKAVTGLSYVPRNGTTEKSSFTKEEATKILNARMRDPDLKKSDRQLVNQYMTGSKQIEDIQHLLKN